MASTVGGDSRFDLGRVIQNTIGAVRHNGVIFAILALLLSGVPALVSTVGLMGVFGKLAAVAGSGAPDFSGLGLGGSLTAIGGLLGLVGNAILQGAVIFGTASYLNGRAASLDDSLGAGLRACLPLIGLSLLTGIAVAFGFLLLIVPGVMMAIAWIASVPALVVERTGVFAAFGRSADLTRGRRWPIFGLAFGYFVAFSIVQQLFISLARAAFPVANPALTILTQLPVSAVLGVVVGVVTSAGVAAIYYELRATREGAGPEALAAVFD